MWIFQGAVKSGDNCRYSVLPFLIKNVFSFTSVMPLRYSYSKCTGSQPDGNRLCIFLPQLWFSFIAPTEIKSVLNTILQKNLVSSSHPNVISFYLQYFPKWFKQLAINVLSQTQSQIRKIIKSLITILKTGSDLVLGISLKVHEEMLSILSH